MTRIICGVDISSQSLDARIGRDGVAGSFAERIAVHERRSLLLGVEFRGGESKDPRLFLNLQSFLLALALEQPRPIAAARAHIRSPGFRAKRGLKYVVRLKAWPEGRAFWVAFRSAEVTGAH